MFKNNKNSGTRFFNILPLLKIIIHKIFPTSVEYINVSSLKFISIYDFYIYMNFFHDFGIDCMVTFCA